MDSCILFVTKGTTDQCTQWLRSASQSIVSHPKRSAVVAVTIGIVGTLGFCLHASFGNPYPPSRPPVKEKSLDTKENFGATGLQWSRPSPSLSSDFYMYAHVYGVRLMGKLLQWFVLPSPRCTLIVDPSKKIPVLPGLDKLTTPPSLPPVKCCLYYPGNDTSVQPTSVYVNAHGGGFIAGSPEDDDEYCYTLCNRTSSLVVSVDYHLAPEYSPPTNTMNIVDTLLWITEAYPSIQCITIGGFSAGGTVALASATYINDKRNTHSTRNSAFQRLIVDAVISFYPPVNLSEFSINDFPDKNPYGKMIYYHSYLRSIEANELVHPLISPFYARVEDYPRYTVIIGGGIEPNKGDIDALAKKLTEARMTKDTKEGETGKGKDDGFFTYKLYPFVPHGWDKLPSFILPKIINPLYKQDAVEDGTHNHIKDGYEAKIDAYNYVMEVVEKVQREKGRKKDDPLLIVDG